MHYRDASPYTTKDGSTIRELAHPNLGNAARQSLAEARLPPGGKTLPHRHHHSEEIYHFTQGQGLMRLAERVFSVEAGDTVSIDPGVPHSLENTGDAPLVLLCCCSPPYRHEDTELLAL